MLHFMANTSDEPREFHLPQEPLPWLRVIDTFLPSPDDIAANPDAQPVETPTYWVQPRSIVVLELHGRDEPILF
jgi:glycogen operon protein